MSEALFLESRAVFMASSSDYYQCDRVLMGIPMDSTTSFRPGTRMAPYRVREVSEGIEEYSIYQKRSLEDICFYDAGDVAIPFGNVEESLRRIQTSAQRFWSEKRRVFAIGGEHLVTLPLVKACHKFYPDLKVIQFDAHADLRSNYLGEKNSHASVMRYVTEEVGYKNVYQLGIRSATSEEMEFAREHTHMYLDQLFPAVDDIRNELAKSPVYISVDIDVLDPAFAPGTGTPEPGGFSSRELFKALLALADLQVVGFDVVEISPPYEKGDNTSILGAKLLREALLAW